MARFENEIQELVGPHKPEDTEELVLDEFCKDVKSFTQEQKEGLELYSNLYHLSFTGDLHIGITFSESIKLINLN